VSSVLLDSHVVHWWSAEPSRVSRRAAALIEAADELVVADITWWELAWLAHHQRILVAVPVGSWLRELSAQVRSVPVTPEIADAAAALPASFPGDPADRLIYATALHHGWQLVTRDRRLHGFRGPRKITVW
jgi:PIN domain nuclease of toxin-antitoxin system